MPDTDGNGILDGDEIFGQSKQQQVQTHDNKITEVKVDMISNGNIDRNLKVESMYNIDAMSSNVYALVGEPFNITSTSDFEEATITFKIDQSQLNDASFANLIILWYNEETQTFEEMETIHDFANSTVSTITTHFSQYMVVDSVKWYQNWETSLSWLRAMWSGNTSYQRNLHTILMVDCSSSAYSSDPFSLVLKEGYNCVTSENIDDIRNSINSQWDAEHWCVKNCDRFDICDGIINNKGNNDAVAIITFAGGVVSNSGFSYNKSYLRDSLDESIGNYGSTGSWRAAVNLALSMVETDINDIYRIVIISDTNANSGIISSDEFASNVILNVVNVGTGSFSNNIDAVAQATGGEVYNAISANDLTYESGELIYTPEQFIGTDSDSDGIPDLVELYGLKPNGTPLGTDPNKVDTDGDGINDNVEFKYLGKQQVTVFTLEEYLASVYCGSDPNKADTDCDELNDYLDNAPLNSDIHSFLIYETKRTDDDLKLCTGDCTNSDHEDYHYANISKDKLRSMKWINWSDFIVPECIMKTYIKTIANDFSTGSMNSVVENMFENFFFGAGGTYSNEILTTEARNHEDSDRYINETTNIINDCIKDYNGDISNLKYNANNRDYSIMVSKMKDKVNPPAYEDKFGGLGICVDGTFGNQIEITSYKINGSNYEYTIKYTIYDIFGLDSEDIANSDRLIQFGILQIFRYWYILQHWDKYEGKYKPFITYIEFEETVQGSM